ncbi:unnamed protein product [Clavelina lepadiformis]|uniref:Uncharacterized protein n=1 Tax=Clavelina lepadiformis TaxID=159417 RepID=A0ABP0GAR9_CLALP
MVKIKEQLTLDASLLADKGETFLRKEELKSSTSTLNYQKPVCPYISSTFVDLEEEFKHLHTHTFVQLNELCNKRGSYFAPLDHRRTALDFRSSSDFILKTALDNVISSAPFFMCVVGNHYGLHKAPDSDLLPASTSYVAVSSQTNLSLMDRNLLAAANHGYPWVLEEQFQMCSMMELEVILACFALEHDFPKYSFIYIKDCYHNYLHKENNLLSASNIIDDSDLDNFFEVESVYAQDRLNDLKRRIVNKGLTVKFFTSKEDLGNLILQDWSEVILSLLPKPSLYFEQGDDIHTQLWSIQSLLPKIQQKFLEYDGLKQLEFELTKHALSIAGFNSSVTFSTNDQESKMYSEDAMSVNGFKLGDGIFSTSSSFIHSINSRGLPESHETEQRIFTLVGDPGTGKTALIAHWLHKFQRQNPDLLIISAFIGSSYLSYDITSFCRRCIRTLREKYYDTTSMPGELLSDVESYAGLCDTFASSLSLVPCLLVIDGVNSLRHAMSEDIGSVKGLSWLPKVIPSNCRIILSTGPADLSLKTLQGRDDVIVYKMNSIDLMTRKRMFANYYRKDVANILGRDLIEKIWMNRLSERPLFLVTLSDLLRSCRNMREMEQVIDKCSAFRAFRDFWRSVFHLWSRRYSWSKNSSGQPGSIRHRSNAAGWVADALKLIATSRRGLTVAEILHILFLIGYRSRATVTPEDWYMFASAAGAALRTSHDGLISVAHNEAKLALEHFLLGSGKFSSTSSASSHVDSVRQQYHNLLSSYFLKYGSLKRKLYELPWHLQQAKDWLVLSQVLCKPRFFLAMCEESIYNGGLYLDLVSYWKDLIRHDFNLNHSLKVMIEQATEEPEVILEDRHELSRRPSAATQLTHEGGGGRKLTLMASQLRAPSMIIVTQHDDHPMSLYRSTEESRSETEDRDFSETESCSFFLTETEIDHHLLVGGWTPAEDDPETLVDSSPLNPDEMANLYVKIAWLITQLGKQFSYDGDNAADEAFEFLQNSHPLSSSQRFTLIQLTVMECKRGKQSSCDKIEQALEMFQYIKAAIFDLSFAEKRQLQESKGFLFLQLARHCITKAEFDGAHKLILDSFDISKKSNNVCGKAHAIWALGKLLFAQGLLDQAQTMYTKAFTSFLKWYGSMNTFVADILVDIGRLFTAAIQQDRLNQRRAMLAYKQALEILEFNKKPVEAAFVTTRLGELLLDEGSFRSKYEARNCFEKSFDVFVTNRLPQKSQIRQTARKYKQVSSDLRSGRFCHGRGKSADQRTADRPYSALSWHSKDLNRIVGNNREGAISCRDEKPRRTLREGVSPCPSGRPPSGAFSTLSVGNYVLVTPRANNSARGAKSTKNRCFLGESPVPSARVASNLLENVRREESLRIVGAEVRHVDDGRRRNPKGADLVVKRPETSEGKEVPVIIVPAGRNSRLSVKLDLDEWERHATDEEGVVLEQLNLNDISVRSELSTPKRSVRLQSTPSVLPPSSPVFNRSATRKHRCEYKSGPDQVSLTVHGPYSTVTDVLRTQRNSFGSDDGIHKSAWFHVPGRYARPGQVLPPKRNQKRSGGSIGSRSRDKSYSARSFPTHRPDSMVRSSYGNETRKDAIDVALRRHSEPYLRIPSTFAPPPSTRDEVSLVDAENEDGFVGFTPTPSMA